ncbi:MAG: hypothetical protein ACTSPL_03950 [Candidatus Odinarchaeia archaeon]
MTEVEEVKEQRKTRTLSEEHRRKIAEAMKRRWAEGKYAKKRLPRKTQQLLKQNEQFISVGSKGMKGVVVSSSDKFSQMTQLIGEQLKPLKTEIAKHYAYDVKIKDVGHRILITPAPIDDVFQYQKDEIVAKGYPVTVLIADCWLVRIAYIYHPIEQRRVGVYLVFCSLWHVRNGVFPHDEEVMLDNKAFSEILDKIDRYFGLEQAQKLLDERRQRLTYQTELEYERTTSLQSKQQYAANILKLVTLATQDVILDLEAAIQMKRGESGWGKLKNLKWWQVLIIMFVSASFIIMLLKFLGML